VLSVEGTGGWLANNFTRFSLARSFFDDGETANCAWGFPFEFIAQRERRKNVAVMKSFHSSSPSSSWLAQISCDFIMLRQIESYSEAAAAAADIHLTVSNATHIYLLSFQQLLVAVLMKRTCISQHKMSMEGESDHDDDVVESGQRKHRSVLRSKAGRSSLASECWDNDIKAIFCSWFLMLVRHFFSSSSLAVRDSNDGSASLREIYRERKSFVKKKEKVVIMVILGFFEHFEAWHGK
jgi:hypothetical protein